MILTIVLLIAAICDAKSGRIPNWLIVSSIATGGAIAIWNEGSIGLVLYLGRFVLVLTSFYPIYCANKFGAGDVKLLAVIVSWLGINMASVWVIWISFIVALLSATFAVVARGYSLRSSVRLGPAFFLGWIIYLGGTYIG